MNNKSLKALAREYNQEGFVILPLGASSKVPHTALPDRPKGEGGYKFATQDSSILDYWDREPNANIGCVPGRCATRYVPIDVDGPKEEAEAQRLGLLSEPTWRTITGRADARTDVPINRI